MLTDRPCPFYTFFHEVGHVIDLYDGKLANPWHSSHFSYGVDGGEKLTLDELMRLDLNQYFKNRIAAEDPSISVEQQGRVASAVARTPIWYMSWIHADPEHSDSGVYQK